MNYDRTHDILYLVIRDGDEHHFVETAEGVVVEFDESNQPIGIEISGNYSAVMPECFYRASRFPLAAPLDSR